jgi:hypothetical protein
MTPCIPAWIMMMSLSALTACSSSESAPSGLQQPPSTCTQVTALAGCIGNARSYACASGRPDDGDPDLVCDRGVPGIAGTGGVAKTLYCCAPYGQGASDCAPAAVAGCGADSLGFACTGAASPDQVDSSLVCSGAVARSGSTVDYCCVPFDSTSGVCRCGSFDDDAGTCGLTPTSCSGAAIGFACAAGHTPAEINSNLSCNGASGDAGEVSAGGTFCCTTP